MSFVLASSAYTNHFDVLILGAGIAGASVANAYLEKGLRVGVVDACSGPAMQCSAHRNAITHPSLGRGRTRYQQLSLKAFELAAIRWGNQWKTRGVFHPAKLSNQDASRFRPHEISEKLMYLGIGPSLAKVLMPKDAKRLTGLHHPGVWFPSAGSLDLIEACKGLLKSRSNLHCFWNTPVFAMEWQQESWVLYDAQHNKIASATDLVLANALGARDLLKKQKLDLFLKPVRGQLNTFLIHKTSAWAKHLPKSALSGVGYCMPAEYVPDIQAYLWTVGSTYDEHQENKSPDAKSDQMNLEQAKALIHYFEGDEGALIKQSEVVGIRTVTKDRLPLIGALPILKNCYVVNALGSRGVLWSTLAAEVIPALSHPSAAAFARLARFGLSEDLLAAVAPARFFAGPLLGARASNSKPILPSGPSAK